MRSLILAAALLATGSVAGEAPVTGADLVEIRAAIHREIRALQGCGRGAAMPPAAAVSFLDLMVMGAEDVVQQVRVTDRGGAVWHAYYALQRQRDGSWRASGCHMVPSARTVSAAYRAQ